MNRDELAAFTGRPDGEDDITLQPLHGLAATLDLGPYPWKPGDAVPAGWQWLYFVPLTPQSQLDADGRAVRGAALAGHAEAKRMFAGGRMRFHRPLRAGRRVRRDSALIETTEKQGRQGPLRFFTTGFTYRDEHGTALEEQHDIVYRESGSMDPPAAAPAATAIPAAPWSRDVTPDPVMLFRLSALTFNGHRIHYDLPYAEREGYPGLVVHGPLLALLLLDLAARNAPGRRAAEFSFRARAPIFVDTPIALRGEANKEGSAATLSAYRHDGVVAMTAGITFAGDGSGVPLARE